MWGYQSQKKEKILNTLFLRLEGVLQSWGERGRWTVRDTARYPTKSGVVGLLGAALGVNNDRLASLSSQLKMGIRVDRLGEIARDYHTVTSGVVMAEGGVKGGDDPQTVVSHRFYLCGASFLVALQGEPNLIATLADAVQNPVWFLSLGRHCCIPSRPIYVGVGDHPSLMDALTINDGTLHSYEIEGGETLRMDTITSVEYRAFQARGVTRLTV